MNNIYIIYIIYILYIIYIIYIIYFIYRIHNRHIRKDTYADIKNAFRVREERMGYVMI